MRQLIVGQWLNKYKLHFQEKRRWVIRVESDGALQKKKPTENQSKWVIAPLNCSQEKTKDQKKYHSKEKYVSYQDGSAALG